MTKTLALLATSTALTVAIGLPAWSAVHAPALTGQAASQIAADGAQPFLILASSEGDDKDGDRDGGDRDDDGRDDDGRDDDGRDDDGRDDDGRDDDGRDDDGRDDDGRDGDDREGDDDAGDDDDDDCDGDAACRKAGSPAPSGSVPPPRNGLFGTGAPPKVQVN